MKVLHITNWYPNKFETHEALFVREQVQALGKLIDYHLVHLEVRKGKSFFKLHKYKINPNEEAFLIETKISQWKVKELIYLFTLSLLLLKLNWRKYDLINYHIAYPMLVYYKLLRIFFNQTSVITEHWSAYHLNFNLPPGARSLEPIRRIFWSGLPCITVSKALANDIIQFSGNSELICYVVPNVVERKIFYYKSIVKVPYTFFMVNFWRSIKNPFAVLKAWSKILEYFPEAKLRIGGYGPLWEDMKAEVAKMGIEKSVSFLGKMDKFRIAEEMNRAHGFLYSSEYETFSVVCAEAVSCGTPIVGPYIPAIGEYIDESNGVFINDNTVAEWILGIRKLIDGYRNDKFNHHRISSSAHQLFSPESVGENYLKVMSKLTAN